MTIEIPENWEHVSGYRLNADGKAMKYRHTERDLEAYIEATLDEHDGLMFYRPSIIDNDTGEFKAYPERFMNKDRALERLRQHMEYYS